MITTLRTPESYLDEVAAEVNYSKFESMIALRVLEGKRGLLTTKNLIENTVKEAANRMCEDAFKAQKGICAEMARTKVERLTTGQLQPFYYHKTVIDKSSILNAPTPFDNQNKN